MIKLGFLGGGVGSIAGAMQFAASRLDHKFEVVGGVFSRSKENSTATADQYNVKAFSTMQEMVENVDVVLVLTPTPRHFEDLKALSQYDVSVICDKPLTATLKEAEEIQDMFRDKLLFVTYNYTGYPMIRELRSMIANGDLGEIKKLVINMPQESFFKPLKPGYPQEWRKVDGEIPNIMLDLGAHVFQMAQFLYPSKIEAVFCECNSFSGLNVVDDVEILSHYKSTLGVFRFSKISLGNTNPFTVEVFGSKAGARWSQSDSEELYLSYSSGERKTFNRANAQYEANKQRYNRIPYGHPTGFIEAFANLYYDISEFYSNGNTEFIFDVDNSVENIRFLDCAIASFRKKKWICLKS